MKGYFGIGVEGVSKAMNVGTLFRTAHAFGASFVFTLRAQYNRREGAHTDTSDTPRSVPTYNFADLEACRRAAGWSGSRSPTRRSSCRASAIPARPPISWVPSARACRPTCSRSATTW